MKRMWCFVVSWPLAVAVTASAASAQLTLGVGGGIVSSTITGDDADTQGVDSETGVSFGAWLASPIGSRLMVVPGAHYVQKGASINEPGVGTATVEVAYLEVPVLLSVSLTPPGSAAGFSVFAGPQIAFEVACTVSLSSGSVSISDDCDPADEDERQTVDLGALIGGGVQFPIASAVGLMISGGVDFGLRKLDTSPDPSDAKNRAFFGSLAATFAVGG